MCCCLGGHRTFKMKVILSFLSSHCLLAKGNAKGSARRILSEKGADCFLSVGPGDELIARQTRTDLQGLKMLNKEKCSHSQDG